MRQHSKVTVTGGSEEEERQENKGKKRVKRKWWILALPPYTPQGNRRQWNQGDRPDTEENPGSRYHQRPIPDTFKLRIKRAPVP